MNWRVKDFVKGSFLSFSTLIKISLNLGLLLMLSTGSLPSCVGEPEASKEPVIKNPKWEIIAEDSSSAIKVWSSSENTNFVFASAPEELMSHEAAIAYCESLKISGFENRFRIPSENEMNQILKDFNFSEIPAFRWHRTPEEYGGVTEKYAFYWIKETGTAEEIAFGGVYPVLPAINKKVEAGKGVYAYSYKSVKNALLEEKIQTQFAANPNKAAGIICISDL